MNHEISVGTSMCLWNILHHIEQSELHEKIWVLSTPFVAVFLIHRYNNNTFVSRRINEKYTGLH
jgi:hypothetical protein